MFHGIILILDKKLQATKRKSDLEEDTPKKKSKDTKNSDFYPGF